MSHEQVDDNSVSDSQTSPISGDGQPTARGTVHGRLAWRLPLGAILAATTVVLGLNITQPEYSATHILEFHKAIGTDNSSQQANKEQHLIRHARILEPLLADPNLRTAPSLADPPSAGRELSRRLSVSVTDGLLIIKYRDSNPEATAKVCNSVAESYIRYRQAASEQKVADVVKLLSPAIVEWKKIVEEKRRTIAKLSKVPAGGDPFKPVAIAAFRAKDDKQLLGDNAELFFAINDYERASEMLEKLNNRMAMLETEQRRAVPVKSVLPAIPESSPINARPTALIVLASIVAFCLPLIRRP